MSRQINVSQSFKRFANGSTSDIITIREERHKERAKKSIKWATKVFQGKLKQC